MSDAAQRPRPPVSARGAARLAAVQALYQLEMTEDGKPARIVQEFIDHRLDSDIEGAPLVKADAGYFADVFAGASARLEEIDEIIGRNLGEGWTVPRLDRPLRQILRAALYELLARLDVPPPVVISEYVEVARGFYEDGSEVGFVNGLLDRAARGLGRLS